MGLANLKEPWKPGQSGNPGGRPKLPPELAIIKSLTSFEVCKIISKYGRMTCEEMEIALTNPLVTVLEKAVAKIFDTSIRNGDHLKLSFLLERAIGRVPEIKETDDDFAARQEIAQLSDQELIRLVKQKLPELEAAKE